MAEAELDEPVVVDLVSEENLTELAAAFGSDQEPRRIRVPPNTIRTAQDEAANRGRFFIPHGDYTVVCSEKVNEAVLQRCVVLQARLPEEGVLTAKHLEVLPLFEAVLDRAQAEGGPRVRPAEDRHPLLAVPLAVWGEIISFSVPQDVLSQFDRQHGRLSLLPTVLLRLMESSRGIREFLADHPAWLSTVLGLRGAGHLGAVLARPGLTLAAVARYFFRNAAGLPDVIRNDPSFRNILRPETRHQGLQKQAALQAEPEVELPPKERAVNLLSAFLMGEPTYRGDVLQDPISGELCTLAKSIAQEDAAFVLKLAHYARHQLGFRNTANFLLALSSTIEPCRPVVRSVLPVCTNLPTDLLEIWDFLRKMTNTIQVPQCLRKAMRDKFEEFEEYQLGKYLNAKVPKSGPAAAKAKAQAKAKAKGKGKRNGKGKGKGKGRDEPSEEGPTEGEETAAEEEEAAPQFDPLTRPLTMKALIRMTHTSQEKPGLTASVLGKRYPETAEEHKAMHLAGDFDPSLVGTRLRVPVPKTWETETSAKGNNAATWEDLVKTRSLPFMAMLRNLRNILMAGVSEETHQSIFDRLNDVRQVKASKQPPIRFLSAFDAIDFSDEKLQKLAEEAAGEADFVTEMVARNSGKDAKMVEQKRAVCRKPPTRALLDRYRDALENAVAIAANHNVPALICPTGGKAIVLVDVSGSMDTPLTQGPNKVHASALTPHRRSTGRPILEGQDMCLEDYFAGTGQRLSKKLSVSMIWIGVDMDLSVMILDRQGTQIGQVSYTNLTWNGVKHSGDITQAPCGAEEVISIDLDQLPENAFTLTFTANSFSGQPFDELPEAAISLRDDGLAGDSPEGTAEICAFRIAGQFKACAACSLIRKPHGWAFRCLNAGQENGQTVQSLSEKIKKEFDAQQADVATKGKRLIDAGLLLALCLKSRMKDQCEVVLFGSSKDGPGYRVLTGLGPRILQNIRRCHAIRQNLGRGTEIPVGYLQELLAAREKLDHVMVLTDGIVAPAQSPTNSLSRWLRSYRAAVQPVRYTCIDLLGLGKPKVGAASDDILIAGYSEAVLRYLSEDRGAALRDVEAITLKKPEPRPKGAPRPPRPQAPVAPAPAAEGEGEGEADAAEEPAATSTATPSVAPVAAGNCTIS